jgi:hypothetical protein
MHPGRHGNCTGWFTKCSIKEIVETRDWEPEL